MEIGGSTEQVRLFTLDEANALIPRVRALFESIQERKEQLGTLQEQLEAFRARKRQGDHAGGEGKIVAEMLGMAGRLSDEIRDLMAEVQAIGCEVKDLGQGLVDFRAEREDRV